MSGFDHVLAAYLRHDGHQCYRPYICTLTAHVAASDNLEPCLLSGVHIIRNEFVLHNLLFDGMPSSFYGQCISKLRFRCKKLVYYDDPEECNKSYTVVIDCD